MAKDNHESVFERRESQACSYARSFPAVFTRAAGSEIWDENGTRYLDFLSGAGSLNYGHNHPVLKQALLDYVSNDGITHGLDLHTEAKEQFLEAFEQIILQPRNLDYVVQFTGPTGANAVEAALKLARKVTGRTNVIHFTNSFHGVSLGALAVTGNQHFRGVAGVPLGGATVVPYDQYLGSGVDTLDYLEKVLVDTSSGVDMPAAVIIELVQGEGGLNVAGPRWITRLAQICKRMGILLIVDDIQAGCGRAGSFFSFDDLSIQPDIVTLSKSLSGYGLPMSVVLIAKSLDAWRPAEHNGTFRGNNHAFVTATAALKTFWKSEQFRADLRAKSLYLHRRLEQITERFPSHIIEVKGRGMMQGLLCADPKAAKTIAATAYSNGLIIERAGTNDEVIKCMMPLTTSIEQLDEGLGIIEHACESTFAPVTPARNGTANKDTGVRAPWRPASF